jgi:hypothetical protein
MNVYILRDCKTKAIVEVFCDDLFDPMHAHCHVELAVRGLELITYSHKVRVTDSIDLDDEVLQAVRLRADMDIGDEWPDV